MGDYIKHLYHPFLFRSILENNQSWLNDNIINAAQTLLESKYGTPGLQNTVLAAALQGCIVGGEGFVQVLNSGGTIGLPYLLSVVPTLQSTYMTACVALYQVPHKSRYVHCL